VGSKMALPMIASRSQHTDVHQRLTVVVKNTLLESSNLHVADSDAPEERQVPQHVVWGTIEQGHYASSRATSDLSEQTSEMSDGVLVRSVPSDVVQLSNSSDSSALWDLDAEERHARKEEVLSGQQNSREREWDRLSVTIPGVQQASAPLRGPTEQSAAGWGSCLALATSSMQQISGQDAENRPVQMLSLMSRSPPMNTLDFDNAAGSDSGVDETGSQDSAQITGELPSAGAALHASGGCRPCHYFFSKQKCTNGRDCNFCHFRHQRKNKERPPKSVRQECKRLAAIVLEDSTLEQRQEAEKSLIAKTLHNDDRISKYASAVLTAMHSTSSRMQGQLPEMECTRISL